MLEPLLEAGGGRSTSGLGLGRIFSAGRSSSAHAASGARGVGGGCSSNSGHSGHSGPLPPPQQLQQQQQQQQQQQRDQYQYHEQRSPAGSARERIRERDLSCASRSSEERASQEDAGGYNNLTTGTTDSTNID